MEENAAILSNYEFNLSDFALFLSVMKNPRAYQCTRSIVMDEPDIELTEVKVEQVVLNRSGKRAIRLDAWAKSTDSRQFNMEMQNNSKGDDVRKRSRYCMELEDGTTKIFLNMTSKNGSQELVSLLQYMKETNIENPNVTVKDCRILELDHIVNEVKASEEWEAVKMDIRGRE